MTVILRFKNEHEAVAGRKELPRIFNAVFSLHGKAARHDKRMFQTLEAYQRRMHRAEVVEDKIVRQKCPPQPLEQA